nr:Chain E, p1-p6 peptide [Human immunodeficiency virus 1]4OBH_F Chain F, p1-p6 peptide [Human immunodeficiency virus 1]4QJ6_E Chain E, p1-p6 peptide [HIV-1 M:B_ARV2/SF2]4QJ6_F Chain F, p1-p6 peptide [HIV-1 M:B_ARV2/SF2]
RPGNFFQSRP